MFELARRRSRNLDMEKLQVQLSLPHHAHNPLPEVERPAGLPINALPGWESIPLHSKLPMLKCPDNQVIFSKNKIGRTFEETGQRDFDSVCLNAKMDYNPLHDPHLRRFYSNEKLLKRLRHNGEITENNDVICTLKEFNEHRIPLHETYLSIIRMERNRLTNEKMDKQMIAHAEKIAEGERKKTEKSGRKGGDEIHERKAEIIKKRQLFISALKLRQQRKAQQIEAMRTVQEVLWRHKKELHNFRIQHRLDVGLDIRRKRLIALKKHLQFKSDRLKNNIKVMKEKTAEETKAKARASWERHLKERVIKHDNLKRITKEREEEISDWIANHMERYRRKWEEIQLELENKGRHQRKKKLPGHKRLHKQIKEVLEKSDDDDLKNLTSEDIHDALYTAIDLQNEELDKKYDETDYIYKAAKYILEGILAKFNKDLSGEKVIEAYLANRISKLFTEVRQYVIKRASQLIATGGGLPPVHDGRGCDQKRLSLTSQRSNRRFSHLKFVTFSSFSALIGKSSYALLDGDLKMTSERFPTPAGSLTSVVMEPEEDDIGPVKSARRTMHDLSRDEQIFIEHLFIKFKRQLIVGIGRQVLAAIECHRHNKILDVRKELKDIDKQFLVKVMTRSILSYAINSCNFQSNTLLCQYALAGDIILTLQNTLLKPERDPRNISQPRSRCVCPVAPPFAKYCKTCK